MVRCSFCKENIEKGRGKIYSTKAGDVFHFCSSKCENNYFMNRNPRKTNWVRKKKK
jgi:large subunit ribosomal protein L24e